MVVSARFPNNPYVQQAHANKEPAIPMDKEQMILAHCDLIKYMALRLAARLPAHVSVDDLFNAGVIGLMDALDKFDPEQQIQFRTYAKIRIKGAMLDEIRAMDWVPRSLRQKSNQLARSASSLTEKLGRYPSDEELATELNLTLESYFRVLDEIKGISLMPVEIQEAVQDSQGENQLAAAGDGPFQAVYKEQIRNELASAIETLPKNEQLILSLYYYEELTMKEIGAIMGYTESRISQLHTKAILRLRTRLARSLKKDDLPDIG
ncbi:MAG TPA: FliA/WhiG family RNA polymerase sigma factor [Syntrophobacteraceae bacterium]|nr:FliA/WhiG family RNA polymerase sigma factor [Syntrophobacteraceae bacterium]